MSFQAKTPATMNATLDNAFKGSASKPLPVRSQYWLKNSMSFVMFIPESLHSILMAVKIHCVTRLSALGCLRLSLIVANIFFVHPGYAVEETQLGEGYDATLSEFMATSGERNTITTFDGSKLYYQRFDQDCNGTVILLIPGWSEPFLKYAEVIYDLKQKHYCVYTYDHRGQGFNTRFLPNRQISYVTDFSDYVNDLNIVVEKLVQSRPGQRLFVIAHSMGGLVALSHAADHPNLYQGLIVTGPMLQIDTGFWPQPVAYAIVSTMDWLGFGDHYVLGHGNFEAKTFSQQKTTSSLLRFELEQNLLLKNKQLIIAGVSNHWLKTSIAYSNAFKLRWKRVQQDVLLFQAGDEHFVINEAEDEFCQVVKTCTKHVFARAKHELLMEKDSIRNEVLREIYEFIGHEHGPQVSLLNSGQ